MSNGFRSESFSSTTASEPRERRAESIGMNIRGGHLSLKISCDKSVVDRIKSRIMS